MSHHLKEDSILEYGVEYSGRMLKDVPASYLVGLYNETYNLPKDLEWWLEDNIDELERVAGMGSTETLASQKA